MHRQGGQDEFGGRLGVTAAGHGGDIGGEPGGYGMQLRAGWRDPVEIDVERLAMRRQQGSDAGVFPAIEREHADGEGNGAAWGGGLDQAVAVRPGAVQAERVKSLGGACQRVLAGLAEPEPDDALLDGQQHQQEEAGAQQHFHAGTAFSTCGRLAASQGIRAAPARAASS